MGCIFFVELGNDFVGNKGCKGWGKQASLLVHTLHVGGSRSSCLLVPTGVGIAIDKVKQRKELAKSGVASEACLF